MPRPMKNVARERQPGQQVSPIREQNVALAPIAGKVALFVSECPPSFTPTSY